MSQPTPLAYFAYGSNMLSRRLLARVPAQPIGPAVLIGHELRWHKVGSDASGKCDVVPSRTAGQMVHGVLYRMAAEHKPLLDQIEGLGQGYDERQTVLQGPQGLVRAWYYSATHIDAGLRPFDWYKAFVVDGAREHGLPADYIAALHAMPHETDPDPARAALNWALSRPDATLRA